MPAALRWMPAALRWMPAALRWVPAALRWMPAEARGRDKSSWPTSGLRVHITQMIISVSWPPQTGKPMLAPL